MTAAALNQTGLYPAVIGAGRMATEYVKALRALGLDASVVVGRDTKRAKQFAAANAVPTVAGGVGGLPLERLGSAAIVAVSHDELAPVTLDLLSKGVRSILLEKPGAMDAASLHAVDDAAKAAEAQVFIAYNRRFYPWVNTLSREIAADGGLQSCHMEFTEWERAVLAEGVSDRALQRWGIVNSTHLLDLGFFFAGEPAELAAFVDGGMDWHPAGSVFSGAGKTERGVLFSYASNWSSAGRWRLDLLTARRRFIFAPLEKPVVQKRYEIETSELDFPEDAGAAADVKTGFVDQLAAFLDAAAGGAPDARLFTVPQQLARWPRYCEIFGYDD